MSREICGRNKISVLVLSYYIEVFTVITVFLRCGNAKKKKPLGLTVHFVRSLR